jgi:hypothetical protein
MLKRIIPALGIVLLSACATAHHGPMQRIAVDSEPKGALVELANCGAMATEYDKTPAMVWVSRRSTQCTLTVSKLGYRPVTMKLSRHVAPEFVGNVAATVDLCADDLNCNSLGDLLFVTAIGGVLTGAGMATDAVSGAMFELSPSYVDVALCPADEQCDGPEQISESHNGR